VTYDPGQIIPNLVCPNCGFTGLMKIVGSNEPGGATCNQCGWIKNYTGSKPGFPNLAAYPVKLIADPTYPPGTEPPPNAPQSIQLPALPAESTQVAV